MPEVDRLQPAFAVGLHVIGEDRAHQHRHMAGDVMKDVRLLKIVKLVAPPDEARRGKAPRGKKGEKHVVRHEAWHRNNAPACRSSRAPEGAPLATGNTPAVRQSSREGDIERNSRIYRPRFSAAGDSPALFGSTGRSARPIRPRAGRNRAFGDNCAPPYIGRG